MQGVDPTIAILVPCYNEAVSIQAVIQRFRAQLPSAVIYVYDNNSSDDTARLAQEAGAVVRHEARQGKGHVIRRMFADIEADIYIIVDGDNTYDPASAPALVAALRAGPLDLARRAGKIGANGASARLHRDRGRAHLRGTAVHDQASRRAEQSRRVECTHPPVLIGA